MKEDGKRKRGNGQPLNRFRNKRPRTRWRPVFHFHMMFKVHERRSHRKLSRLVHRHRQPDGTKFKRQRATARELSETQKSKNE